MTSRDRAGWSSRPGLLPQSPVLALLVSTDGLWAGGIGAVAHKALDRDWTLCSSSYIRTVLVVAECGSTLFVAGVGGVSRSTDRGSTWVRGQGIEGQTVLCLATSPEFGQDTTLLAGTTESGVLRSADGGATWTSAQFGMQTSEVSDLVWLESQTVLASTPDGLYRSTNGGRSWRRHGSHVFLLLHHRAGVLVAIAADGSFWFSDDFGEQWLTLGSLPPEIAPQALTILSDGTYLVASEAHGVLHSSTGETWTPGDPRQVLAFASSGSTVYAGTDRGVIALSGAELASQDVGAPQLFDYCRLHLHNGRVVVSGVLSSPQRWSESEEWRTAEHWPAPVRAFARGWGDELLVTTPDGVWASDDDGETWLQRCSTPGGDFLTTRADGVGWMGTADGSNLMMTRDRGRTWSSLRPPFGVLPIVALQSSLQEDNALLLAVTYDAGQQSATLWRSADDGATWERGNAAATTWPVVATMADPLAVSIGSAIVLRGPDGIWMRTHPGTGNVRQLKASESGLVALTQDGLWLKRPADEAWLNVSLPGASDQVVDIDLDGAMLAMLLTGGDVHTRMIDTL